jgi:putative restriction endonuclease
MLPPFISGWDLRGAKARVAFGVPDQDAFAPPENAVERRYALRAVKLRPASGIFSRSGHHRV